MFKLPVLIALVCSLAVNAQHVTGCDRPGGCEESAETTIPTLVQVACENASSSDIVTIQQLHQTIQIQAQTIQSLLNTEQIQNLTSLALAAHCATDDVVRSVVDAAVAPLQKTLSDLMQAQCGKQVAEAVAPLQDTVGTQIETIQLQNNTIQDLIHTIQNMNMTIVALTLTTTLTPTTTTTTPTTTTPTTTTPTVCGNASGYRYVEETDSCYKYHGETLKWTAANATCVAEGAHLAVINGKREAQVIGDMVKERETFAAHVGYYQDDAGEWQAVTGESAEAAAGYNPWDEGFPLIEEPPLRYGMAWDSGHILNESDNLPLYFICEMRPQ